MWTMFWDFPPDNLWLFLTAGILLNLTPGADVMFATACGLRGGVKAGAAAGLGVGLGGLWHVGLATLGISALLAAMPTALLMLKWGGAGYLLVLAWKSWNAGFAAPDRVADSRIKPLAAVRRGFIINAFNPKVALFILAFLPQFTDPALGPLWQQIVVLGCLFAVTGTVITAGYGVVAGLLGGALAARMKVLNRIAAAILGVLALRLVWN